MVRSLSEFCREPFDCEADDIEPFSLSNASHASVMRPLWREALRGQPVGNARVNPLLVRDMHLTYILLVAYTYCSP